MNILYLAHRIPYPPNKGEKIRAFHEIKHLSQEHSLFLAFLVDDPDDRKHIEILRGYCHGLAFASINPRLQRLKTLPALLSRQPLSVPYFYSAALQAAIDRHLDGWPGDAVFCYSSPMAEYVFRSRHFRNGRIGKARLIMDFVDVDSDKWRMYAGFSRFPFSWIYRREWQRLQEYETRVGRAFDRSILVSDKEVALFRTFCPEANLYSIPNGVDLEYFSAVRDLRSKAKTANPSRPPTILFMGAMDYYPNEDAVVHFVNDIFPLVKEKAPAARFVIVGGKPTPAVKRLAQADSAITVTGFVPDVRPYLAEADVFVAPFRIARGIQNKVLEAMASGVPVVARPEAVQGLRQPCRFLMMEDDPIKMAAAVADILLHPGTAKNYAEQAEDFVRDNYIWGSSARQLTGLLQ